MSANAPTGPLIASLSSLHAPHPNFAAVSAMLAVVPTALRALAPTDGGGGPPELLDGSGGRDSERSEAAGESVLPSPLHFLYHFQNHPIDHIELFGFCCSTYLDHVFE